MHTTVPVPALATLHLVCGKIASGKSTLTRRLAAQPGTILISEDEWLGQLFPDEISSLQDYVRCTSRLRALMGAHVAQLLRAGVSVVLDFPANTLDTRSWMRSIIDAAQSAHCLHYVDVSDEECKRRLKQRNSDGSHRFTTSEAQFDLITSYFVAPSAAEGFDVVRHQPAAGGCSA